jgi:hypothetical protein
MAKGRNKQQARQCAQRGDAATHHHPSDHKKAIKKWRSCEAIRGSVVDTMHVIKACLNIGLRRLSASMIRRFE